MQRQNQICQTEPIIQQPHHENVAMFHDPNTTNLVFTCWKLFPKLRAYKFHRIKIMSMKAGRSVRILGQTNILEH